MLVLRLVTALVLEGITTFSQTPLLHWWPLGQTLPQ